MFCLVTYDKKVTNWLYNLVDDFDAFNSFAWGHYVFKMTMHYLRHGFRSRDRKKGSGSVRYWLYGFPWTVEAQVFEVLEATEDDETQSDYWVGVDFDMSMGPQFIPLVEMKEKNELVDNGDDGDDGGDGDDGSPCIIPLKRKAPKQKKKRSGKQK
ncbi:hypothetical protein Ddye_002089 [Dipteronia dyeriana]|uniref:Aminotransferase-like plant mobile domain-containing protein n=1 Tax=Dipteronia dyeriana TaxID=168575 RepID=A0AAD9XQG2_9ROSI|nr:hypothetical protein Ddye_002089 [Dipteronia dyeriana]